MVAYVLDLLGCGVFAVSGALAAGRAGLDLLGVIVVASVTAIGGGTLRDLLLNRHPIFWIRNPTYLIVIWSAAIATVLYSGRIVPAANALLLADAFGLALFAISGAQIAEAAALSPVIIVLMGTMTGVAGGVLRDILTTQVPLILRGEIYATAAIVGIAVYLLLQAVRVPRSWAVGLGLATVVMLRLLSIVWGLHLPVFNVPR